VTLNTCFQSIPHEPGKLVHPLTMMKNVSHLLLAGSAGWWKFWIQQ